MQKFTTNHSLKWYYTSICFGLALIFGSQYFTYQSLQDLSLNNKGVTTTIGILNQTANFGLATKDFQSNMRGYLITQDEELLSDNYRKRVQLVEISDTLFNLVKADGEQTKRVKELLAISSAVVSFTQKVITLDRIEGSEKAFNLIKEGEGKRLDKLLSGKINEIEKSANQGLLERRKLVLVTQKNSTLFIFSTSIIGLFLTMLAGIFLLSDQRKQKQLQKEINEKERILTQYLEAIPDGVMVVNTQKEIVLLNQSGREILGIKGGKIETVYDELSKVKLLDPTRYHVRFTPDSLPVARGLLGEKLTANKIDLIKDNKIFHLESNVQPVIGLEGEVTSAITVFRDITERANYETTLENARVLAEKSVRVKDIFLSNVSHEIRTPLNAIIGFTNLLVAQVKDAKSTDYVNYIQIASKNLLELINDILDFSKIEAGQIILEKTPASIKELIDSVSIIIDQRAAEKNIRYVQTISEDLPKMIETDKLRMSQILLNVCGNAIKFTEKGEVRLTVEPVGEVIDGSQRIRFIVQDSGIGIPNDKLKEVFNRFVQAAESTTRIFGGTGLGLSIVKSLVEIFEGTIVLKSEVGKGSTFTMEFPMKLVEDTFLQENIENEVDISSSISSLRVLAAEDNTLNQKLLQAIFERLDISLTIVGNGLEAIERLEKEEFDLVLMDIQMPVMDGYTAIKQIRSSVSKTIPIITMTAHAMVGEKEECLSIGANSYISKPFKEKELLYTIAHLGNKENSEPALPKETQRPVNNNHMPDQVVDLDYLFEITGGDTELRDELISMFENESEIQLNAITVSAISGDGEKLRLAIHKFRSSLFSVGLLYTANQYKELEAILKQGSWQKELNQKLEELKLQSELGLSQLKLL
ncbi:response regulator [Dyadobacter sp. NIV53]|uniref:response regulator n=1 Tax=Dyadobacter sp. NIV53 TaxID=2861765 RepID=UPI001C87F744|nr:response regulator [Dyadobacter sp. NIV53]